MRAAPAGTSLLADLERTHDLHEAEDDHRDAEQPPERHCAHHGRQQQRDARDHRDDAVDDCPGLVVSLRRGREGEHALKQPEDTDHER